MKTLVVGNSLDVLPAIEHIHNAGGQAALFATEGFLPYDRSLLPGLAGGDVRQEDLFRTSSDVLARCCPAVITDESLGRISVKRRHLTTVKKTQIDYDRLILVDTGELILPAIRGRERKGVFDCWRLSSIKALQQHLPFADGVMVAATRIQGLNMACVLNRLKKEVTVISSAIGLLPEILDDESGLLLKQILEGKGIRVISENAVEEILGEAQVKAVKLKSGKVLGCDAVIFDEARADIRMLSEPALTGDDEICIEDCFKLPTPPLAPAHFGCHVLDGFYAGWTKLPDGGREYLKFDGPQNIYKKIYALGHHLAGVVTFNAPQDNDRLLGILQRQDNITGKEEEIL
ncbi:MAG: NAD-binding protein [Candidatus Omnitrophica bacterium]|nr:NAD-binding protein [Candidatus Omnitrophota bacterium]MDE2009067.1 NAD-binding protein [Candidatus Omnitrophota bacterium]MDE2231305.1 NAD-binding protein [Candidatus Omnitrophota bacterium]